LTASGSSMLFKSLLTRLNTTWSNEGIATRKWT